MDAGSFSTTAVTAPPSGVPQSGESQSGESQSVVPQSGPGVEPLPAYSALAEGARRVLRCWPALLLMLLGTLLSAGLLALVTALNLFNLAHRPVIAEMAAGVTARQLVDLAGFFIRPAPSSPVNGSLAIVLLGFAILQLAGGVVSAFLYGGVLLAYKEDAPRFRLGRFLWGGWHWFGAYLVLGLLQALLFVVLYLPLGWLVIFELARVRLVLNGTRNPFKGIALAFSDLFHRPLPLLAFYAAALLLLLGVQAVFRLGINPRVPLDALLPALIVQQGFILARLFCQGLRLAGLAAWLRPPLLT